MNSQTVWHRKTSHETRHVVVMIVGGITLSYTSLRKGNASDLILCVIH